MPEYQLTAAPPLAGHDARYGDLRLHAPGNMALVSIALPFGGEDAALGAVKSAYGSDLPEVGKSATAKDGARLIRLGADLAFVLFQHGTPDANQVVQDKLRGAAYTTDQTDVWCALELSGKGARAVLERICPLDLHDSAFAVDDAKRTVMEHLGVIILRIGTNSWLLLSASSSAGTFLHAVETSIKNAN